MDNNNNSNKPNKHKNSFLKFLPKAASAVSFQNPPFSPGRDRHHHAYKGFSGPINFAVLPDEAREKPKNGSAYDSHEPTSPKISCMGQIKSKHHKKTKNKPKKAVDVSTTINDNNNNNTKSSSPSSVMRKFFGTKKKSPSKGKEDDDSDRDKIIKGRTKMMPPPSGLGQMRKFASGRETLRNFDWTAQQIAPIDHDRDCYSDEERRRKSDNEDDDEDEDDKEVIIPFSAPMMLGGGRINNLGLKPRKEVNLWKRRTMDPPPPLALKSK